MDISPYRWRNRLLLVFATSSSGKDYKEQLRLLEGLDPEFEDRDLLPGKLPEHETGELDGTPVSAEDMEKLRNQFDIESDVFAVLLVGKDGGEKFRSNTPVTAKEIFSRIDAMPMRRRGMRERG